MSERMRDERLAEILDEWDFKNTSVGDVENASERFIYEMIEAVVAEREEVMRLEKPDCLWSPPSEWDTSMWEGTCGVAWEFMEDGPVENEVHFCPRCGGKVIIAEARG